MFRINMKSYLSLIIILLLFSSCTTAILDEGEVEPINETITYEGHVKNIITNYCITCHGTVAPSADLDLSTYNALKNATENGNLIQRVNDVANPMPPNGLMPAQTREILNKWVIDGYLEQ